MKSARWLLCSEMTHIMGYQATPNRLGSNQTCSKRFKACGCRRVNIFSRIVPLPKIKITEDNWQAIFVALWSTGFQCRSSLFCCWQMSPRGVFWSQPTRVQCLNISSASTYFGTEISVVSTIFCINQQISRLETPRLGSNCVLNSSTRLDFMQL